MTMLTAHWSDPCWLAVVATAITVPLLVATRMLGPRGVRLEMRVLAVFLIGMPLVYLARALMSGVRTWTWFEALGVLVFLPLAVFGLTRSPWFLIAGIAAHGLAWDAWHYRNSAYIPDWYSAFCFLVDVVLSGYALSRLTVYKKALMTERQG